MLQEEVKSKSSPEEQMVGRCFLQHAEAMKTVYTEYCVNHDKAEQLLEKYDQIQVTVVRRAARFLLAQNTKMTYQTAIKYIK
jgi:uncharacterized Zn finger protein